MPSWLGNSANLGWRVNVIAPIVYGKTVHIHPAIVLLAIPAGGAVAGNMGMFIAVPVAGVVAASWRSVLAVLGDRARAINAIRASAAEANAPPGLDAPTGPQVLITDAEASTA